MSRFEQARVVAVSQAFSFGFYAQLRMGVSSKRHGSLTLPRNRSPSASGSRAPVCHDFGQSFGKIAYRRQSGARGSSVSTTPLSSCCDSTLYDCRRISDRGLTGRTFLRHLRGRVRARGFALADRAMDGRAFARARRRGEGA
jgi:hypothetical protein